MSRARSAGSGSRGDNLAANYSYRPYPSHPTHTYFGDGAIRILPSLLVGKRVLGVASPRGREAIFRDVLADNPECSVEWLTDFEPNPSLSDIDRARILVAGSDFDLVLGFGGGSALDVAKALSVLAAPELQGVSIRDSIGLLPNLADCSALASVVVPTTAGTGAEVTQFATVWDKENKRKLSLSGKKMFPSVAIVDPRLTYSLPPAVTVSTGLDALNQAFESIWNTNRSADSIALASDSISLAVPALRAVAEGAIGKTVRESLSEASLLAGLAISITRTSICHSISYPLTAHFGVPHGLACAFSMPAVMEKCIFHVPEIFDPILPKTGHNNAVDLLEDIRSLISALNVQELVAAGVGTMQHLISVREEMLESDRAGNFLVKVTPEELVELITVSLAFAKP